MFLRQNSYISSRHCLSSSYRLLCNGPHTTISFPCGDKGFEVRPTNYIIVQHFTFSKTYFPIGNVPHVSRLCKKPVCNQKESVPSITNSHLSKQNLRLFSTLRRYIVTKTSKDLYTRSIKLNGTGLP